MNHFICRHGSLALAILLSACAGPSRIVAPHGEPLRFEVPVSNNPKSAGPMLGYRVEQSAPNFLVLNSSISALGPIDVAPGKEIKLVLQYEFAAGAPMGCFDTLVRTRACSPNVWPRYQIYAHEFIGVPSGGWLKRTAGSLWARISCLVHKAHARPFDPASNNLRPPDCPKLAEQPTPQLHISPATKKMVRDGDPEAALQAVEDIVPSVVGGVLSEVGRVTDGSIDLSTAPIYSISELAQIDHCLDSWEVSEHNLQGSLSYQCHSTLGNRQVSYLADLLLSRKLAKRIVNDVELEYYRKPEHFTEYMKLVARRGLGDERIARLRRIFMRHLSSGGIAAKVSAIGLLTGPYSSSETLHAVVSALDSPDSRVRFTAAVALERNHMPEGRPVLLESLNAGDKQTFFAAVQALGQNTPASSKEKLEAMAQGKGFISVVDRVSALSALSSVEGLAAAPIYIQALRTPDKFVVSAALSALNVSGSSSTLTLSDYTLIADFVTRPNLSASAKAAALGIFSYASSPAVRDLLIGKFRSSEDPNIRAGLARAMRTNGKKSDVPWLMSYLDDPSEDVQKSAESAISTISGARFYDEYPKHRDRVAKRKEWWAMHKNDSEYQ